MWDEGVFEWLAQAGAQAALVRQISNPLAGTDTTMLALAGSGFEKRRAFGFMSCERAVGAAEGMNVLQEQRVSRGEGQGRWSETCCDSVTGSVRMYQCSHVSSVVMKSMIPKVEPFDVRHQ